jgi:hypothetical protein
MAEYNDQIRNLADAVDQMQGRVLAAEQAAMVAETQRREIAARLVAAGREFRTGASGGSAGFHPTGSPRLVNGAPAPAAVMMPLVDTRNIGKVPNFFGEREQWNDWSFQFARFWAPPTPRQPRP